MPAMFLCAGLSTFLGSAMIFATGVIYGLMALGKKYSIKSLKCCLVLMRGCLTELVGVRCLTLRKQTS